MTTELREPVPTSTNLDGHHPTLASSTEPTNSGFVFLLAASSNSVPICCMSLGFTLCNQHPRRVPSSHRSPTGPLNNKGGFGRELRVSWRPQPLARSCPSRTRSFAHCARSVEALRVEKSVQPSHRASSVTHKNKRVLNKSGGVVCSGSANEQLSNRAT